MPANDRSAVSHLDIRVPPTSQPCGGWLRAVREALGLSRQAIASKLNVTQAAVRDYELAEVRGAISLATLRRVADALGCEVAVALVPRNHDSLEALVAAHDPGRSATAAAATADPEGAGDELAPHLR